MLSIPDNIKELFKADNIKKRTQKKFRLYFRQPFLEKASPWLLIENDRIVSESLQITESLSSDEELTFGSCEGAEMQITVADVIEDVTGKEFTLTVEIGGYEMALGIYTVKSFERQSDRRKRKIIAYDRMQWFNVDVADWYNNLTFPMMLKTFRDLLCEHFGIEQNKTSLLFDTLNIEKTISPAQLSGIEVLKSICELNGCFAHIDKEGNLQYISLQQTGLYPSEILYPEDTLYPSEFGGDGKPVEDFATYKQPIIYQDYLVEGITGLTIRGADGTVAASVGENANEYVIEGNFLTYEKSASEILTIANSLLPHIYGRVYRPVSLECNFLPWLEVGDAIRVFTKDDIIESFITKRTVKGCQNMRDKIESTGSQYRENKESLHDKLVRTEKKMVTVEKTVDNVSVVLEDFEKDTLAKLEVTAGQITAEVKRATQEEEVLKGQISINEKNILLKVSKGDISAQLSQESGEVRITGDRFSWQSTNSSMTADGTLTCKNIKATQSTFSGEVSSSKITGGTITGTKITGNTINASIIEAATITGSNINLDVLVAAPQMQNDDDLAAEDGAEVNIQNISTRNIICSSSEPSQIDWVRCSDTYVGPIPKEDSDFRLKKNIFDIKEEDAMKVILSKRPVAYLFKRNEIPGAGFIAQEVKEVSKGLPFEQSMYRIDRNGCFCIPYLNDIGLLTSCIQNIKKRMDAVKLRRGRFENTNI